MSTTTITIDETKIQRLLLNCFPSPSGSFYLLWTHVEIVRDLQEKMVADLMETVYADYPRLLVLVVQDGGGPFGWEFYRALVNAYATAGHSCKKISMLFVKASSYGTGMSSGADSAVNVWPMEHVRKEIEENNFHHVVIVDDICDTGNTLHKVCSEVLSCVGKTTKIQDIRAAVLVERVDSSRPKTQTKLMPIHVLRIYDGNTCPWDLDPMGSNGWLLGAGMGVSTSLRVLPGSGGLLAVGVYIKSEDLPAEGLTFNKKSGEPEESIQCQDDGCHNDDSDHDEPRIFDSAVERQEIISPTLSGCVMQ